MCDHNSQMLPGAGKAESKLVWLIVDAQIRWPLHTVQWTVTNTKKELTVPAGCEYKLLFKRTEKPTKSHLIFIA